MKGKVLLWAAGMAASLGTVIWCELDSRKRRKEQDEYWKKVHEETDKIAEAAKADLEYMKGMQKDLQDGMEEIAEDDDLMAEIIAKLKAEGKWLETEEDAERYFTE